MAGHSKFKNIMHRKSAQDRKKARTFTKIVKLIKGALTFGSDPSSNPRLKTALALGKEENIPKDVILNAIESKEGASDNEEEVRYEGYGPYGVPVIIETITDNRNRTAGEIRAVFSKFGGNLGELGSVSHMFNRVGVLLYNKSTSYDTFIERALVPHVIDCVELESFYELTTEWDALHDIIEVLLNTFGTPKEWEIEWRPTFIVKLESDNMDVIRKMLDALYNLDDVEKVFQNVGI
ncbi:YebC/PmpR family DNA-binding transcriptional regulator [Candidatus Fokinia crypta]|uniref:Probable transcriptional regulatory protein Fokcrypt_00469 n=1 Tax=Candidatus Fokinia crypta TaxID=1920990 RepID=A0ABZ0UP90_9RICK|nr:YebC/PmpR family DNA-binding transcriptional regulator [Candidatus Fokinia cryptica]WPX97945.1 YebC family transcriptional regulator [Candidatus Fokinia cryptica]